MFVQRNGLARETSDFIGQHQEYVANTPHGYSLKISFLNCEKQSATDDIADI